MAGEKLALVSLNFGMDTGSNNLVQQQYYLLEKLEEQAIYIIQLNDAIQQLQEQNKQQEAHLQALEAQAKQNTKNTTVPQTFNTSRKY